MEGRVIHATQYWTETNIADGLNALAICIEVRLRHFASGADTDGTPYLLSRAQMVIFSAFMMYAYTWKEYVVPGRPKSGIWRPLWDSINYGASPLPLLSLPHLFP